MSKEVYICCQCKKQVPLAEDLLFVEEFSYRGFCRESCIITFFEPYMQAFVLNEESVRKEIKCFEDFQFSEANYQDTVIENPDEIWKEINGLGETYYTHILNTSFEGEEYSIIYICFHYEGQASFILHRVVTQNETLLNYYRSGDRVDKGKSVNSLESENLEEVESNVEIPSEILEEIELKKSQYLADLLDKRKDSDIAYEDFLKYESYLSLTLDDPDDVFQHENDSGDNILTYVKSFQYNGKSFFYMIICWSFDLDKVADNVLVPVLAFPSLDNDLYNEFAVGDKLDEKLKN